MTTTFTSAGLRGGVWQGVLHAATPPRRILVAHNGQTVATADVTDAGEGSHHVSVRLPASLLADGLQTFLMLADDGEGTEGPRAGAARLANLPVLTGPILEEDLRSEIQLLRAELDLLKREVRRLADA